MSCNLKLCNYHLIAATFPFLGIDSYYNLNTTGTSFFTRTGIPFSLPGFHFGIALTTRRASLSSAGSTLLLILTSDIEPSFSMIICTITRPCMPFSCATIGYFNAVQIRLHCTFTTRKSWLFINSSKFIDFVVIWFLVWIPIYKFIVFKWVALQLEK